MAIIGVLRRGQQELGTTEVLLQNQTKALSAFSKISIALSKGIGAGERCYKKRNEGNIYSSAVFSVIHGGVGLTDSDNQAKGGLPGNSVQPRGSLVSSHLLIIAIALVSLPFLIACSSRMYPSFHLCVQFKIIQLQNFRTGSSDNTFILLLGTGVIGEKSPEVTSAGQHGLVTSWQRGTQEAEQPIAISLHPSSQQFWDTHRHPHSFAGNQHLSYP